MRRSLHRGDLVLFKSAAKLGRIQPSQYVSDPGSAYPKVAGKGSPVFKLAGVEQRLVIVGELQRITGFLGSRRILRFRFAGTVPGYDLDNGRSTQPVEPQGSAFNESWFELSTPRGAWLESSLGRASPPRAHYPLGSSHEWVAHPQVDSPPKQAVRARLRPKSPQ